VKRPTIVVGETSSGKTATMKHFIRNLQSEYYVNIVITIVERGGGDRKTTFVKRAPQFQFSGFKKKPGRYKFREVLLNMKKKKELCVKKHHDVMIQCILVP